MNRNPLLPLLLLSLLAPPTSLAADDYVDRNFRVTGQWDGARLVATRVQLREDDDNPTRGQVSGAISRVEARNRTLEIGPVRVYWNPATRFEKLSATALAQGMTVRVSGTLRDDVLIATSIRPQSDIGGSTVQLTGIVTSRTELGDGTRDLEMLGVGVRMMRPGFNAIDSLVRRQDSRRSDAFATRTLLGRPIGLGAELKTDVRDRNNYDLDNAERVVDSETELSAELYFQPSQRIYLFASIKGVYQAELLRDGGREPAATAIERDQTWIYFDRLAGSGFGLQLGRQNFKETRSWWWDDDLDAARVYYDHGPWHMELGVARELARVSSLEPAIAPEQDGVTRVLGTASWLWAPRQTLQIFAMRASDGSAPGVIGTTLVEEAEDDSDARLTWVGLRAIGSRAFDRIGEFQYWIDTARVSGTDTSINYGNAGALSRVRSVTVDQVNGSAFDAGLTWRTPLPGEPSLTVSYASARGGFRQTGLQENKWRYNGVNRFRNYGEVLRPELANLKIATISLGIPLLTNSSVELAYHRFQQQLATDELRDARITNGLTGRHTAIGDELDVLLGFREGRRVDFAITAGVFRAGSAYGTRDGDIASLINVDLRINF